MAGTSGKPFIVKKTTGRDIAIGVIVGLLVLGFILYGILHMSQGNTGGGMLTGKILAKHFRPQPEEQLSVGQGGLVRRDVAGQYTMDVAVPGEKTYTVWVEQPIYDSKQVGDQITFLPPPPKQP